MTPLQHMTTAQAEAYAAWLKKMARKAKGSLRSYFESAAYSMNPWGTL